jgi:hypothetical protein
MDPITREWLAEDAAWRLETVKNPAAVAEIEARVRVAVAALELLPDHWTVGREAERAGERVARVLFGVVDDEVGRQKSGVVRRVMPRDGLPYLAWGGLLGASAEEAIAIGVALILAGLEQATGQMVP